MARIFNFDDASDRSILAGSVVAFGVFDGFHVGHRALVDAARDEARALGARCVVLTFSIDPDELFHADSLRKLTTNEARIGLLAQSGADAVCVLPFTREFARQSPAAFLEWTFRDAFPRSIHVGAGFRFGAKAAGTEDDLRAWGSARGTEVRVHELRCALGAPVSATRIRGLLAEGDVKEANELLGRPFAVSGTVVSGRGEGAQMGIRTANLDIPQNLRALGDGVYAAWATVDGKRYKAAVNMGVAASFADRATATCEAHLLDFEGDIYGDAITLEFVAWLRAMRVFDDVDELVATIQSNISWVRENL